MERKKTEMRRELRDEREGKGKASRGRDTRVWEWKREINIREGKKDNRSEGEGRIDKEGKEELKKKPYKAYRIKTY